MRSPGLEVPGGPLNGFNQEVHKFGGSSLANADCYRRAAAILQYHHRRLSPPSRVIAVVSARAGVTDQLFALLDQAAARNGGWREGLARVAGDQETLIKALLSPGSRRALRRQFAEDFAHIRQALEQLQIQPVAREPLYRAIPGWGEIWSARVFTAYLNDLGLPARYLDARHLLFTKSGDGSETVDEERTLQACRGLFPALQEPFAVAPGYVATDEGGAAANLGRNGSDYSAALITRISGARSLTIWSDVDGVLSMDPDLGPGATTVPRLSFGEAETLARLGSGVLHPRTIAPILATGLPLSLRNSFQPHLGVTRVDPRPTRPRAKVITGLARVRVLKVRNRPGCEPSLQDALRACFKDGAPRPLATQPLLPGGGWVCAFRPEDLPPPEQWSPWAAGSLQNQGEWGLLALVGQDIGRDAAARARFHEALRSQGASFSHEFHHERHAILGAVPAASWPSLQIGLHQALLIQPRRETSDSVVSSCRA